MHFLLALKWKLYEKGFLNIKTKTSSSFAVKVTERTDHLFLLSIWESLCSDICTIKELKELNYCVNIWKTSEAANSIFHWFFVLNSVTSTWVSLRQKEDQYILKIIIFSVKQYIRRYRLKVIIKMIMTSIMAFSH